jgi:vancomycin permeability regulator SanA
MNYIQDKYKTTYFTVILVLLLNLIFIFILKYLNQGLALTEFSFFNPGNMINMFFVFLLAAGLLVLYIKKEVKEATRTIISLLIIINLLLITSAALNFIDLPLPDYYIYDYHISRVIVGIMFALYQFMLLIFVSAVWIYVLAYKKYLFLRTFLISTLIILFLFVFSVLYLNINNMSSDISNEDKNNIGVVLGAAVWSNKPSPSLSSRADKAAELLIEGKISTIQLTGSNAPGELSESEMAYNYLRSKNIEANRIRIESETTSTNEQIKYIKDNLYTNYNIVIISDSYHLPRIKEICRFHNMEVKLIASDLAFSFRTRIFYNLREAAGLLIFWLFGL